MILVLDRWPTVDAAGHLVFSGAAVARDFPASEFQALVDQRRTQAGQPAADRALRVGDVFWIRVGDDKRPGRAQRGGDSWMSPARHAEPRGRLSWWRRIPRYGHRPSTPGPTPRRPPRAGSVVDPPPVPRPRRSEVSSPQAIPDELFVTGDLIAELQGRPEALALFVLNVGDGDAQVVLLPTDPVADHRRAIIVDAATTKPLALIEVLTDEGLLPGGDDPDVALVVATHPHQDHIGGMAKVLAGLGDRVAEFWDPGYFHPIGAFHQMMAEVETRTSLLYSHPASGLNRWIGRTAITVLSPSIHLRNRSTPTAWRSTIPRSPFACSTPPPG